jgi:hypothetical protein
MAKYRTDNRDSNLTAADVSAEGTAEGAPAIAIPPGRVGVYDPAGNYRGHVGPSATSSTAARFHGVLGSKLGTKNGAPAWLAPKKSARGK